MKITRIGPAVVRGNVPWVRITGEANTDVAGLWEAARGFGVTEPVEGERLITQGCVLLNERPGHSLTLDEETARALLKPALGFFGDGPHR